MTGLGDTDLDLVLGGADGTLKYFQHDGAAEGAAGTFTEKTGGDNPFAGVDAGEFSAPTFTDVTESARACSYYTCTQFSAGSKLGSPGGGLYQCGCTSV